MPEQPHKSHGEARPRPATPRELQRRCLLPGDGPQESMKAVSRAEQALEQLSVNFDEWMRAEVRKLTAAREITRSSGLSGQPLDALFSAAHDLKGQATTLGYPFAAEVCVSLCRLIDACAGRARIPEELVDQHVDAVAAIVRERAKGHDHPKASILARKLGDVTADYLAQLGRRTKHAA